MQSLATDQTSLYGKMRLFLLTAVVLNLRLLLAVPMLDRRNAATSAQLTSDEQPSAGDDKVVSFLGGLAVGGTTGYFIGQQQERNINNPNRRPPPRANSPTPEATVNLPVLRAAPKIFHEAEIDEEMEKRRSYEKMRELQTRIYTTLQMDPDGFDWVYECKRLRVRSDSYKILSSIPSPPWRLDRLRERERVISVLVSGLGFWKRLDLEWVN